MQDSKMSNEQPDGQRNGLLASNDLVYLLPPDLSVSVNQTHKNQYFQSTTYTNNQRGVCLLNTGADYGDMRHSSLEFGVSVQMPVKTQGAWFGRHGSVLNLIKSITISSRSGDELARIQDLNLLNYTQNGYRYDKEWHETIGQTIGLNQFLLPDTTDDKTYQEQRFSIPLYLLSDFFGYGRLLPPMVLSGLRIEIEWATPVEAFVAFDASATGRNTGTPVGTVTSYTILNPYVSIRAVQLTDSTQRALNEMSAVNGLELVYCDYERTDRTNGGTSLHMEIRKAASRALKCVMTSRRTGDTSNKNKDSLRSEEWDVTRWQWQLGSLYFPQQPVYSNHPDAPQLKILAETYKHALICYDKYRGTNNKSAATPLYRNGEAFSDSSELLNNATTTALATPYKPIAGFQEQKDIGEPTSNFEYGTFVNGNAIVPVTLERSDLFNLSGVPINNSRVLAIRADFGSTQDRTITTFLKYVRLARVFMTNVEVEQ